jgi:hypothetical protein
MVDHHFFIEMAIKSWGYHKSPWFSRLKLPSMTWMIYIYILGGVFPWLKFFTRKKMASGGDLTRAFMVSTIEHTILIVYYTIILLSPW